MRMRGVGSRSLVLAILFTAPIWAQFSTPIPVSTDNRDFTNVDFAGDSFNNFSFVFDDGAEIFFSSTLFGGAIEVNVTQNLLDNRRARVISGAPGIIHIVYEEQGTLPGSVGSDIKVINNSLGGFSNPADITMTVEDERNPDIAFSSGAVYVVFSRRPAAGPPEVHFAITGGSTLFVAQGENPVIVTTSSAAHIGYQRNNALYYRRFNGATFGTEIIISNLAGSNTGLSLAADNDNSIHAAFSNSGFVFYTNNRNTGAFQAPSLVDTGPVTGEPVVAATGIGQAAIGWPEGGQIFVREHLNGALEPLISVTPDATQANGPGVEYDKHGFLHVSYEEAGIIYYTNTVPAPVAAFSADVTEGEIELTVSFENLSTGLFNQSQWDFGDGETSTSCCPTHTYTTAGTHTVSLTVSGAGGSSTETKRDYIVCLEPTNILEIESIDVFASEQGIVHPVRATNTVALQGFQLATSFDPAIIDMQSVTLHDAITGPLDPEFVHLEVNGDEDPPHFIVAVIMEISKPFDGKTIPPGARQIIANMHYDIPITTPLGASTVVDLQNGTLGDPPINNIFTVEGGLTVLPFRISGVVTVNLPQVTFLRSDANADGAISLLDGIFILAFVFQNGPSPTCQDAADFDDDGAIGLLDALDVLNFIFANGAPPSYPYPGVGVDPTEDALPPCQ